MPLNGAHREAEQLWIFPDGDYTHGGLPKPGAVLFLIGFLPPRLWGWAP